MRVPTVAIALKSTPASLASVAKNVVKPTARLSPIRSTRMPFLMRGPPSRRETPRPAARASPAHSHCLDEGFMLFLDVPEHLAPPLVEHSSHERRHDATKGPAKEARSDGDLDGRPRLCFSHDA